eukprot:SM000158S02035  [mRNA]  locus=s158:217257:219558:+ [translate_table: standard]
MAAASAAASVDPQRQQPQLRRALVERPTTDGGGVTGSPNPNHHWATVFEKEGSPVFGRTHWRSDRRYERYAFTRIDGSRVHSTPDLAHLAPCKHRYSCNGTMHDTAEETLRKFWPLDLSHSEEVINWHDRNCDTWIQTSLIGGPFNITWKYWRTYKLPTKEGIKNTKYLLWPGVLDYLFEDSDIVVVNLGTHYSEADQEELALHYEQLAVRMEAFNRRPGRLAFFRQTLTQHFYSPNGTGRYRAMKGHPPHELTDCHAVPNVFWQA